MGAEGRGKTGELLHVGWGGMVFQLSHSVLLVVPVWVFVIELWTVGMVVPTFLWLSLYSPPIYYML